MPNEYFNSKFYSARIYSVRYLPFDGGLEKDFLLCRAFREFFESGRTAKGDIRSIESGLEVRTRYKIGKGNFYFSKYAGKLALQETYLRGGGKFRLVSHAASGELVSETIYDSELRWEQTAYYAGSAAELPKALLRPSANGVYLLALEPDSEKYRRRELLSCPYRPGTAAQSYVNSAAGGEPQVCASTDAGEFCYCPAPERELRLAAQREAQEENRLKPAWPDEPDELLKFRFVPNDYPHPRVTDRTAALEALTAPDYAAADYAVNHELFSIEVIQAKQVSSAKPVLPEKPAPVQEQVAVEAPAAVPASAPLPALRGTLPPQPALGPQPTLGPQKYAVAAKGLKGGIRLPDGVVHADELKRNLQLREPETQENRPIDDALIPAKRIVVSSAESYLYFGSLIDGLRDGQGRTQMPDGHTAYEGGYCGDRRDGFGVYYYKSGRLCYAGGWKQNQRDGVGVAFGAKDGSVFVGGWKNNIPTGSGSAFDVDGNLIYTGEWLDGKRHGQGTEYRRGHVCRTGQWRGDRFYAGYEYIEGHPVKFGE